MQFLRLGRQPWIAAAAFALLVLATPAAAEITFDSPGETQLSLYGFLKLDAVYQSDGMNSLFAPRFAAAGEGSTNFTAMHSRFGLKWAGPELDHGLKVGGVLEWDLFDNSRNQMHFRDRLAALTLAKGESTWLFGQHWDVFSPLNVTTLMTNGNLWQTGNLGFRRAQIRYSHSGSTTEWAFSANDPTSDGATDSQLPIFESRIGFKFADRGRLGLSAAYGQDQRTVGDRVEDFDIAGLSLDWVVPMGSKVAWKGEAASGENLGVFLSRSGVGENHRTGKLESVDVTAFWTQIVYSGDGGNLWFGVAAESLDDQTISATTFETTQMGFVGIQFKVAKGVLIGIEAATFRSELPSGEEVEAQQGIFSATYSF